MITVTVVKTIDLIRFFFKFITISFSGPPAPSSKFLLLLEILKAPPKRHQGKRAEFSHNTRPVHLSAQILQNYHLFWISKRKALFRVPRFRLYIFHQVPWLTV